MIVACLTFPSKVTGCDRLQVGAATRATSIISRLTDIAVLDLHFLGIEIRTFLYLASWINMLNCPRSVVLDDDGAVAEAHGTAAGRFLLRSHNLFIKELPPMILDIFATQRQAAELVSWSEELSLLPQTGSGSTVELLICVITMLRNAS